MARRGVVMDGIGYRVVRNMGRQINGSKNPGVSYSEVIQVQEVPDGPIVEAFGPKKLVVNEGRGWREATSNDYPLPKVRRPSSEAAKQKSMDQTEYEHYTDIV